MVGDNPRRVRPAVQPRTWRTRIPRLRRRDHTGATRLRHAGVAAAALHGAAERVVGEDPPRECLQFDVTGEFFSGSERGGGDYKQICSLKGDTLAGILSELCKLQAK